MKYLCLAYYDPAAFDGLAAPDLAALGDQCGPHDAALRATGQLGLCASLEHRTAVTVRQRGGKMSITDGPFIESKELVGSFFLVEAADLAEAVRVASLHPAAQLGESLGWGVEVRPIEAFAP
jgi:hypothetical protein